MQQQSARCPSPRRRPASRVHACLSQACAAAACRLATAVLMLAGVLWGLAGTARADGIRVVTEELAPYNMTRDGIVTGMSTEVVRAVMHAAGMEAEIHSMPWARAYDIALNAENVLIYSITRTAQREPLFKWVGVVAPTHRYLYAAPGSGIRLERLSDAQRYQIATVKDDAGEQYLVERGFEVGRNLQSNNRYEYNYEKFKAGRVDLWISIELNALFLMREAGDDPAATAVRALALPDLGDGGLYMAFSRNTPDALVERFREAWRRIREDGTYDAIAQKWR